MKGISRFPSLAASLGGIAAAAAVLLILLDFRVVEGSSMEPLLKPGLLLVVLRPAYILARPKRGDLVVFRSPLDGKKVVKRCAALSGDPLLPQEGGLSVAGRQVPLDPSQAFHFDAPTSVPEGHFFALGDNPLASVDSRDYGPVLYSALAGRVIGAAR